MLFGGVQVQQLPFCLTVGITEAAPTNNLPIGPPKTKPPTSPNKMTRIPSPGESPASKQKKSRLLMETTKTFDIKAAQQKASSTAQVKTKSSNQKEKRERRRRYARKTKPLPVAPDTSPSQGRSQSRRKSPSRERSLHRGRSQRRERSPGQGRSQSRRKSPSQGTLPSRVRSLSQNRSPSRGRSQRRGRSSSPAKREVGTGKEEITITYKEQDKNISCDTTQINNYSPPVSLKQVRSPSTIARAYGVQRPTSAALRSNEEKVQKKHPASSKIPKLKRSKSSTMW